MNTAEPRPKVGPHVGADALAGLAVEVVVHAAGPVHDQRNLHHVEVQAPAEPVLVSPFTTNTARCVSMQLSRGV